MENKSILKTEKCKIFGRPFPKLIFISGKGGVGKTTISSALAVLLAEKGFKTLIISTDPAHSIGDIFTLKLKKGIIHNYSLINNLFMIELSIHSDNLENKKYDSFFSSVFFPSLDEFLIVYEISDIIYKIYKDKNIIDYILFDMAPTGHTLRLISFPKKFKRYIEYLHNINENLYQKYSINNKDLKSNLENLISKLNIFLSILKNPNLTEFIIVGIPDYSSIIESKRFFDNIKDLEYNCNIFLLNKIENYDQSLNCCFCTKRQNYQTKNIILAEKLFKDLYLIKLPLFSNELKNLEGLYKLKNYLRVII